MIDGVFWYLHRQIRVTNFDLARQARHAGQAPRAVKQIFFVFTHFAGRFEAVTDDDVAGGASERLVTGMLDADVGFKHRGA